MTRKRIQLEDVGLHDVDALDRPRLHSLAEALDHCRSEIETVQRPRTEIPTQERLAQREGDDPVPQPASSTRRPERRSGDPRK